MSTHISLTSEQVVFLFAGMVVFVMAIIFAGRFILYRLSKSDLKTKHSHEKLGASVIGRRKYPEVDIFQYRGIFTGLGLSLALALVIGLLAWTTYDTTVDIPQYALTVDEDITIEPPRTAEPPPPPPPPPPPVIQEVSNEMIMEDEDVQFMDQSIEAETVVEAPEPVAPEKPTEVAPPPPPPPPAPKVEEIFKVVEEMPRFPGCEDKATKEERKTCSDQKLLAFIYSNIKYPAIARENNVQGSVVVSFVVNRDGSIEQITVLRDIGAGCGQEATRVINLMSEQSIKWIPGKQRGNPVRVQFLLPIKFKLVS